MKNPFFDEIKGRFGFGCMRLPVTEGKVDEALFCRMVDAFLEKGFNYFDTARGYLEESCESVVRRCLVERHPRESFVLTDKLSTAFFESREQIRPLFERQLADTGAGYFDFYLMHAQSSLTYGKFKDCGAYEIARQLKAEGKVRHIGISFHDTAAYLEQILREQPDIEVVQLQFNYVDYNDPAIQSGACYEVCRKYGKPVLVMEPVKGGNLASLPEAAGERLRALGGGSPASYALRFAAGFDGVMMVLSGMKDMAQLEENTALMAAPAPLTGPEREALEQVKAVFREGDLIPCTGCRYCTAGCPMHIAIPDLFACLNAHRQYKDWSAAYYYRNVYTMRDGKASDCIGCGQCEQACPQHLPVRALLQDVAAALEAKEA